MAKGKSSTVIIRARKSVVNSKPVPPKMSNSYSVKKNSTGKFVVRAK